MNTFVLPHAFSNAQPRGHFARLKERFGSLAAVLALHAVLGYAMYSGMVTRVIEVAMPDEVFVEFVPPKQPPAPAPAPSIPRTVELAPPPVMTPPVVPVVIDTPTPNAITVARAQPAPVEKASAPVAVAAAPAAPAQPAGPRTITSGVEYVQAPQPVYPAMSKRMGEQGKVILRVLVDEKGQPNQVIVQSSSGFARLDEAGRQAALRAVFKPYMEDGRAVAVYVIVPLNFSLS